jgi:hypothetical protein
MSGLALSRDWTTWSAPVLAVPLAQLRCVDRGNNLTTVSHFLQLHSAPANEQTTINIVQLIDTDIGELDWPVHDAPMRRIKD